MGHMSIPSEIQPQPPTAHFLSGGPRYPPKALRSLFPKQELIPRAAAHPQPAAEPQSHQRSGPLASPNPSAQLQQTERVPVRNSSPDLQPGAVTKSMTPTSLMGKAAWCWPPSRPKQGELLNLSRSFWQGSSLPSCQSSCSLQYRRGPKSIGGQGLSRAWHKAKWMEKEKGGKE